VSIQIASHEGGLLKYLFLRLTVGSPSCLLTFRTTGRSFHQKAESPVSHVGHG